MPDLTELRRSTDPRIRALVWDVDTARDDTGRMLSLLYLQHVLELGA